jgi:hypothetical protein
VLRDGYEVVEWGTPYDDLVAGLNAASRFTRCRIAAFHEMTVEKIAKICHVDVERGAGGMESSRVERASW